VIESEDLQCFGFVFIALIILIAVCWGIECLRHRLGLYHRAMVPQMNTCEFCMQRREARSILAVRSRIEMDGMLPFEIEKLFQKFENLRMADLVCDVCWDRIKATL